MSKRSPTIVGACIGAAATIIAAIIVVVFTNVFSKSDKSTSVHESTEVSPDSVRALDEPVGGTTTKPDESTEQIVSTPEYSEAIKDETFSPITLDQFYETNHDNSLTNLQKEDFVKKQMNRRFIWEGLIRKIEGKYDERILVIIESKTNDRYMAFCWFGKEHRQDLLSLKPKQHIKLTGILSSVDLEPFLRECKLLEILD
jgi:hypothetical protein